MHVRVGLLNLVKQHDAVGFTAHRFSKNTPLTISDVPWRCALECGDRVRLLELAHVNCDEILFATVQGLCQRQCGFGLANAAGTNEHKYADWFG